MNGRERPGPNSAICSICGRRVGLLVDATFETHTPAGDPYAPACPGRWPEWRTAPETGR